MIGIAIGTAAGRLVWADMFFASFIWLLACFFCPLTAAMIAGRWILPAGLLTTASINVAVICFAPVPQSGNPFIAVCVSVAILLAATGLVYLVSKIKL